jgi:hypothetical protein
MSNEALSVEARIRQDILDLRAIHSEHRTEAEPLRPNAFDKTLHVVAKGAIVAGAVVYGAACLAIVGVEKIEGMLNETPKKVADHV